MTIIREPDSQPRVTRHHAVGHKQVRGLIHNTVHKPVDNPTRHRSLPRPQPRWSRQVAAAHGSHDGADVYLPTRDIRIDTMFWQHRSIFAGTQEQLNELRRDADARAAARARAQFAAEQEARRAEVERRMLAAHRPVFKRLKPIVLVGLVPMLWAITTCRCGERWPCNDIKLYLRRRVGWTVGFDEPFKELVSRLPKPATRWTRFKRWITRRGADSDQSRRDGRSR